MKYFIDTEFIEYPCTIDLISIGIVREDGKELYCISNEFDSSEASDWVKNNVLTKLPDARECNLYMSRETIKGMILEFTRKDPNPEFWGYYCDYDWVVFCWLFGSMVDLPKKFPMYCRDLKQLCDSIGNPKLPEQGEGEHNALEDARWIRSSYEYLFHKGLT